MKKLSLIVISFICVTSFSQNTEGLVTYVESLDMTGKIEEMNANMDSAKKKNPERAAMMSGMTKNIEEFMKSFEKTSTQLYFKNNTTLYKEKPAELTESEVNQETNFMMAYKPKSDIIYYNKNENKNFIQKDFMGKQFLVKDTLKNNKWKIVMEQKIVKGYPCMKAVKEDTLYRVEAWFSSQIPVSSGPKGLYGLPGMILEAKFIKINKDEKKSKKGGGRNMMEEMTMDIVITAETIEIKEIGNKMIKAPTKGKVLKSEAEYIEVVTEKVKEMQKGGGRGSGGFRMRM
jgi:GLPGLI family protein